MAEAAEPSGAASRKKADKSGKNSVILDSPQQDPRGSLMDEIVSGKELKKVPSSVKDGHRKSTKNTFARGGLLHEIRSRATGSEKGGNSAGQQWTDEETKQQGKDTSPEREPDDLAAAVYAGIVREGWMHKRGANGIWSKRCTFANAAPPAPLEVCKRRSLLCQVLCPDQDGPLLLQQAADAGAARGAAQGGRFGGLVGLVRNHASRVGECS